MSPTRISVLAAFFALLSAAPASAVAPPAAAATVASDGTLVFGIGISNAGHLATGLYVVYPADGSIPTSCAYTASAGGAPGTDLGPNLVNVQAGAFTGTIFVRTYSGTTHAPADLPFNLYVAC